MQLLWAPFLMFLVYVMRPVRVCDASSFVIQMKDVEWDQFIDLAEGQTIPAYLLLLFQKLYTHTKNPFLYLFFLGKNGNDFIKSLVSGQVVGWGFDRKAVPHIGVVDISFRQIPH